jgi:hypothetical protein
MTSTCDRWIQFVFAGICLAAAPFGVSPAHAQGFGPDPFRPFNSMYDQYVYPIRPETGGSALPPRGLGRNDNQFQQYLLGLEGANRLSSERYAAGLPYWRVRTDLAEDRLDRLNRRKARNDDALATITQKYLAYFSEENPTKRAALLRENTFRRRERDDEADAPGRSATRDRDELAPGRESSRRAGRDAGGLAGASRRAGAASSLRGSTDGGEETTGRRIPAAPPISRFSAGSTRTQRRPSETLDRSRKFDDGELDRLAPRVKRRAGEDKKADRPSRLDDE